MSCSACRADPATHSFSLIRGPHSIVYTSFAKVKDYSNSEAILAHMRGTLEPIGSGSWVWVIDCDQFALKHAMSISSLLAIARFMRDTYASQISAMYILNSGTLLQGTIRQIIPLFDSTFTQRLTYLNGSPLQLMTELPALGFGTDETMVLVATVAAHRAGARY